MVLHGKITLICSCYMSFTNFRGLDIMCVQFIVAVQVCAQHFNKIK